MGQHNQRDQLSSPSFSPSAVKDICSVPKGSVVSPKKRVDKTEGSEQNGTFCEFPPLDSVQPAACWEAAVRSGASSNPRVRPRCAGPQPDLMLHHTGDDLGHPVYREDREGMPPGADPEVPPSLSDGLQVSVGGGRVRGQEVGGGSQHLPAEQLRHLSRRSEAETGSGSLH